MSENKATVIQPLCDLFVVFVVAKSYNGRPAFMSNIQKIMDKMQILGTDLVEVVTRPRKENMIGGCCHGKHAGRCDSNRGCGTSGQAGCKV